MEGQRGDGGKKQSPACCHSPVCASVCGIFCAHGCVHLQVPVLVLHSVLFSSHHPSQAFLIPEAGRACVCLFLDDDAFNSGEVSGFPFKAKLSALLQENASAA